jgi:hypothetical protein
MKRGEKSHLSGLRIIEKLFKFGHSDFTDNPELPIFIGTGSLKGARKIKKSPFRVR